ncbi:MAG: transcriptional regulator WhiB [Acidimicrobiia bacterium]|nr:MAG: transcriptional regulator WhiB [Acidimicrobiia bacterium]
MDWRELAACAASEVDFFPPAGDVQAVVKAKAVCFACPVRAECLEYALATEQPEGVWGGLTRRERVRFGRMVVLGA